MLIQKHQKYVWILRAMWIFGVVALLFLIEAVTATAYAAYNDIPRESWYQEIVTKFQDAGYLHRVQTNFNPSQNALRSDFIQILLDVQGGMTGFMSEEPGFADVSKNDWFYPYMEEAGRLAWVKGDGECFKKRQPCFARPYGNINRAEAAALLVRAFGFEETRAAPHFDDNDMGQWYTNIIQTSADHCVLQGDSGTGRVRPGDLMNRAEMVAMIDRASQRLTYGVDCGKKNEIVPKISSATSISSQSIVLDFNTDLNPGSVTDTLRYRIANAQDIFVINAKLVRSQGIELTFNKQLTAGKVYSISVSNMLTKRGKMFADNVSFKGYTPLSAPDPVTDTKTTESELLFTVTNTQMTKKSIPRGAQGLAMLSVDIRASCDSSMMLEGFIVTHEGFGLLSDISGVYVMYKGDRLTRTRTIEKGDNTTNLHFTKPFTIPACQTRSIDIVADITSDAATSSEHRLAIRSPTDIASNAKVINGIFPLRGVTHNITPVTTGVVTIDYRSVTPAEVKVGQKGIVIGRMDVSANSAEHQTLHTILLKQDGSIKAGDIENIRIRRSNGVILTGTVAKFSTDTVLLRFDPPFLLKSSDRVLLEVVADIIGGAGRTIQMRLDNASDLFAIGGIQGKSSNVGSRVVIATKNVPTLVAVDAGGFIVEVDGPSQQSYDPDRRGAVLANVLFTSGNEPASVHSLYVLIQGKKVDGTGFGNGTASDDEITELIKNVKLRNLTKGNTISGVRLSGTSDFVANASKTYQIYRFDQFNVRGKENWKFEVDFANNGQGKHPVSGDTFRIAICGEPTHVRNSIGGAITANTVGCDFGGVLSSKSTVYQMRIDGLSTGDRITDVRPRGSIVGNIHFIATSAFTVTQQFIGNAGSTVKGARDVSLLRFEARAGSARDIILTRLSFDAEVGSIGNGQNYALWVDTNNDSEVDTMIQSGASPQGGILTFNRLTLGGVLIPAAETLIFEVRSAIASSPPSPSFQLRFATSLSNFIEAEEADGSTLTGINTNATCVGECDIAVTTASSKLWTIGSQGNLFVTAGSPMRSHQLLGGSLSDPVLKLTFRADNEPIQITDIQITSAISNASSIERLELFRGNELVILAIATQSACGSFSTVKTHNGVSVTTFCASIKSETLVLQPGQEEQLFVRAKVAGDAAGGISGQSIQFWITGQTSGSVHAIRARGLASNANLIVNDGNTNGDGEVFVGRNTVGSNNNIFGPIHTVSMARLESVSNASVDPNGTAVPVGTATIGQFAVKAQTHKNSKDGSNNVVLKNIRFIVNATNVSMDATQFRLMRKGNESLGHTCIPFDVSGNELSGSVSGSFFVSCTALDESVVSTIINQGVSVTFTLRGMVLNPSISGKSSVLQVSLSGISDALQTSFDIGKSAIEWVDTDSRISQSLFWIDTDETVVNSTSYRN